MKTNQINKRLEEIRESLRNENISYGEILELQSMVEYIDVNDIELHQAAGVHENIPE